MRSGCCRPPWYRYAIVGYCAVVCSVGSRDDDDGGGDVLLGYEKKGDGERGIVGKAEYQWEGMETKPLPKNH